MCSLIPVLAIICSKKKPDTYLLKSLYACRFKWFARIASEQLQLLSIMFYILPDYQIGTKMASLWTCYIISCLSVVLIFLWSFKILQIHQFHNQQACNVLEELQPM